MLFTTEALNTATTSVLDLFYAGKKKEALERTIDLRDQYPGVVRFKRMLGQLASQAGQDVPTSVRFAEELVICLDENFGDARRLLIAAGEVLRKDGAFIGALSMLATGSLDANRNAFNRGWLRPVTDCKLFHSLLRTVLIVNKQYEFALTNYRKLLLYSLAEDGGTTPLEMEGNKGFFSSLARQCWLNEYVYYIDDDEYPLLERLREEALHALIDLTQLCPRAEAVLHVVAMYQPLHELGLSPEALRLADTAWQVSLYPLISEIDWFYQEQKIKRDIPVIGTIENEVSLAVRNQYEENPYPRWLRLPDMQRMSFGEWISSRNKHFNSPDFLQHPIRLLVAGCGTGQEVISAYAEWETSQILAIDLSRSSLAYAIRMAHGLGAVSDIEFRQADILGLADLPKQYRGFDVICCGGVLHHMEDPMKGWSILVNLLRTGGVMRVALYSELSRSAVVKAHKCITENDIQSTPDGIRRFRRDVFSSRYPGLDELQRSPDLYSTSTCRDLLFHEKEWRFHIEDIIKSLDELNLRFIGFDGIERSKQKYRRMFPEDPHMTDLENWSRFECKHPDTFQSMYIIYVQKT